MHELRGLHAARLCTLCRAAEGARDSLRVILTSGQLGSFAGPSVPLIGADRRGDLNATFHTRTLGARFPNETCGVSRSSPQVAFWGRG